MRLVLLGLLLLAAPLEAQSDRWQRQIDSAMMRASAMATSRGYAGASQRLTGSLFIDETELRSISLVPNGDYLIVGVCDGDCRSLNLVLRNPNGDEIAYDRQDGNAPFVTTTKARGGVYQVKVIMRGCRRAPCRYGLAVYQRR